MVGFAWAPFTKLWWDLLPCLDLHGPESQQTTSESHLELQAAPKVTTCRIAMAARQVAKIHGFMVVDLLDSLLAHSGCLQTSDEDWKSLRPADAADPCFSSFKQLSLCRSGCLCNATSLEGCGTLRCWTTLLILVPLPETMAWPESIWTSEWGPLGHRRYMPRSSIEAIQQTGREKGWWINHFCLLTMHFMRLDLDWTESAN